MKKIISMLVLGLFLLPVIGFTADIGTPSVVTPRPPTDVGSPALPQTPNSTNPNIIIKITNPLRVGVGDNLFSIIEAVMRNIISPLAAVLVVLAILYSGFRFITAQGNPTELEKARQGFLWALVGSAVLLGAYGISTVLRATIGQIVNIN